MRSTSNARWNDEDRRKITRSRNSSFNFGKSRPVVFPSCIAREITVVQKRRMEQKAGKWSAEQKHSRRKNVSGVRMRERRMERKKSAWRNWGAKKKKRKKRTGREKTVNKRGRARKRWCTSEENKGTRNGRMNGTKRTKETREIKTAARNGEDRKITRKSSRIEEKRVKEEM